MNPITCTWAEGEVLDRAEAGLINLWSTILADGSEPAFIAGLIASAVDFDPRLGMPMDNCTRHGCNVLVDEAARDEHGLFCSQECADTHAEQAFEAHIQWGLANGYVRPAAPTLNLDGRRVA